MIVLVTGSREWTDRDYVWKMLDEFDTKHMILGIIEGEARGVDTFAREWAEHRERPFEPHAPEWERYGKGAGPIRNGVMLRRLMELRVTTHQETAILAFHENIFLSKGTRNMCEQAFKAGIPVTVYPGSII